MRLAAAHSIRAFGALRLTEAAPMRCLQRSHLPRSLVNTSNFCKSVLKSNFPLTHLYPPGFITTPLPDPTTSQTILSLEKSSTLTPVARAHLPHLHCEAGGEWPDLTDLTLAHNHKECHVCT